MIIVHGLKVNCITRHLRKLEKLYKFKSSNETYYTFVNYKYFYRSSILIAKNIIIIILKYYNTRKIYSFINSLTKIESVIFNIGYSILFNIMF